MKFLEGSTNKQLRFGSFGLCPGSTQIRLSLLLSMSFSRVSCGLPAPSMKKLSVHAVQVEFALGELFRQRLLPLTELASVIDDELCRDIQRPLTRSIGLDTVSFFLRARAPRLTELGFSSEAWLLCNLICGPGSWRC